jgi:predicted nucleotidyltransferase component of viral defense system
MIDFLRLSVQQREEAFRATATRKEIDPFMIEKDFWVVLVLEMLFSKSKLGKYFAFKGGTSLSKAYHLIRRFSEDIDLIIDWRVLGYDVGEPWVERSKNQQNKFNLEADARAKDYIKQVIIPELNDIASTYEVDGIEFTVNELDGMTIDVSYPRLFANTYSLQTIRLEIGPLAAWSPSSPKEIQAYIFEEFPSLTTNAMISIPTVEAKRTFWEKAVILHREANRNKITGYRYSRHYYDLYKMSESSIKNEAFADMQLLKDVVLFNMKFYPVGNAKFEEAVPGTFRILPSKEQIEVLQKDYIDMGEMFFEEPVTFGEVIERLNNLEQEINQLV